MCSWQGTWEEFTNSLAKHFIGAVEEGMYMSKEWGNGSNGEYHDNHSHWYKLSLKFKNKSCMKIVIKPALNWINVVQQMVELWYPHVCGKCEQVQLFNRISGKGETFKPSYVWHLPLQHTEGCSVTADVCKTSEVRRLQPYTRPNLLTQKYQRCFWACLITEATSH